MENLQNLSLSEKRKWLIEEMKKWSLDENDIINDDCDNKSIVCGNSNIEFGDIFNLFEQLDWKGFSLERMTVYIDLKVARNWQKGSSYMPSPDEFTIEDGILRIWYD